MTFPSTFAEKPAIRVVRTDWNRLRMLANAASNANDLADELLGELDRAEIVPGAAAEGFIGIGTQATYRTTTQEPRTATLVLPGDADITRGRVSIMTPIGVALLGLSAGQSIQWQTRDGRTETLTVLSVGQPPFSAGEPDDDGPSAA